MTFLETGAHTHRRINPTLPSISVLPITRWLLSPAIVYYKSLEGKGLACWTGSISCLLGYWTRCGSLIIVYSPLSTLRRTDFGRNASRRFSVNLECRGIGGTFSAPGGSPIKCTKVLASPLQPSAWSNSLH